MVSFRTVNLLHIRSVCHLPVGISVKVCVSLCARACVCVRVSTDAHTVVLSYSSGCPIHHVEREQRGLQYEHRCIPLIIKGHTEAQRRSDCFAGSHTHTETQKHAHTHTHIYSVKCHAKMMKHKKRISSSLSLKTCFQFQQGLG